MYIHNVQRYKSSYKYNNVPNMDSMMLTYFWIKFISMPLFTVCAVIHTIIHLVLQFLIQKDQVPVPCTDLSCVGESCMSNTKERKVHVQRKRYQKSAKHAI